ncbi:MAG TPA: acyltransferase, partial [Gemmataceae bacterium]|nr:acyltransferase [Gemmataceae bacterium]
MGSESSPAAGRSLPPPGTHLPGLDGLRGVAILLVLAFHLLPSQPVTSHVTAWIYRAAWSGWCGVDLFFVLSGFLITGILLDAKGLPHYFRNFYARRTLRIFPLYYGVLVVIFVIVPLFLRPPSPAFEHLQANQIWLWCYASNVCTVWANGWVFLAGNWHLNHFWSLAVEEQFYLVWPLVVLLLSRRRLLAACALCVVAAPLLRWAFLANGYGFVVAYTFTPCRVDALAVGAAVAVAARAPGGLSALRRFAPAVALALGAALLGLFVWRHGLRIADEVMQTAGYSLLALFF